MAKLFLYFFCCAILTLPLVQLHASEKDLIIDTRGPVINAGMTVKVDEGGVQAPGYVWQESEPKVDWAAKWIGSSTADAPDSIVKCLRKEVTFSQKPTKVTAWVTADNFILYVNGTMVARGPADPGRDFRGAYSGRHFYSQIDLTPFFHHGKNVIAAELLSCNDLLFEAKVQYPDKTTKTLPSDETWKGLSQPFLKRTDFPVGEADKTNAARDGKIPVFDAAAEPVGWQLAGFDDSQWPACQVVGAPAETLALSELPPVMETRYPYFNISNVSGNVSVPVKPFHAGQPIIVKGNGQFAVHFNKIMAGRCGIKVKGCQGATVYLFSNETNTLGGRGYVLHLRDGIQYYESSDYYALGTINVVVRDATSPVEIMDVSADFASQPVEYLGSFTCSDEKLNELWKSDRWSTQICMMTHHLDSPQHQEPIGDYGDYVIEDLVNYYAMGNNPWLARQDLIKWSWVMENAKYQTFHTSYMLYWLQALMNYYDYTGDERLVEALAPSVHAVMAKFSSFVGKNGIISQAPNYMFMDWVTVYDDKSPSINFACHHPPAVIGQGYMTALFYHALVDAERVSQITQDSAHAGQYETLRQQIAAAYQRELWNREKGMYRDGKPFVTTIAPNKWLPADVQMESFSVQNNTLAVLYDLAPANEQPSIIDKIMADPHWDVTPFFMHFVYNAIAHAGLFDKYAVSKFHENDIVPETQTVREKGTGKGDYSHGWVASPAYQMSSKILGVTPTAPGFATFAIRPNLCGLTFAHGTIPSPHGDIKVAWKRAADQFKLNLTIPSGTKATVALPTEFSASQKILLDDKIVWNGKAVGTTEINRGTSTLEMELPPGSHKLTASSPVSTNQ